MFRIRAITRAIRVQRGFHSTSSNLHDAAVVGLHSDGQLLVPRSITDDGRQTLNTLVQAAGVKGKTGESRVLYGNFGLGSDIQKVAVVGLGKQGASAAAKDRVRMAVATGVKALKAQEAKDIGIAGMGHDQAAAEGAILGQYKFNVFKTGKKGASKDLNISSLDQESLSPNEVQSFEDGLVQAQAQNLARTLMETPANHMTPTIFAERFIKEVEKLGLDSQKLKIHVRDCAWAEEHKMGAFLSVAKGSDEPLKFLEIQYHGGKSGDKPLALVGKGVTFDSGGISIKPSANMGLMKGDMGGAATVAAAVWGIASLKLPINVVASIPLCENMPSGKANKPGDVVTSMSGKTIEVDNTDAEGRLILADALTYTSKTYRPHTLIDLATLTGAMDVALGSAYAGVFSTSDSLWSELKAAGEESHEQFWRMPLHSVYLPQITTNTVADLINTGGRSAGSCTAAVFLREFVHGIERDDGFAKVEGEPSTEAGTPLEGDSKTGETENDSDAGSVRYAHIDIAGVMDTQSNSGYYVKGMTGRPARALIEFAKKLASS
ncbi:cytosol aminopeptidase family, catalytic domain-containing protein [Mortierella sp. GBAus27b]|nr:bleomycin hydrolase [Mortierella sp. GBA43]KAI8357453.1 cytosol aminopeptidase family, catalytic domain-containing protein [Mortierella sp. GBAus27b]